MEAQNIKVKQFGKSVLIINYALLLGNIILILGVVTISLSRNTFAEISAQIHQQGSPIMGSKVLDLFLRKEVAVFFVFYMIILLLKEYRMKILINKLCINLASIVLLVSYAFFIIFKTTYYPISSFS